MKLRSLVTMLAVLVGTSFGQSTNSGDIRGVVTDSTGAAVPGVNVTVENVNTGVSKVYVTNNDGVYDTSSIVAGALKNHVPTAVCSRALRPLPCVTVVKMTIRTARSHA